MAPKAPAAAGGAVSCIRSTEGVLVDGLAMCIEMIDDTQNSFGNGFPWENSTFFFASFRNQYLYPSATLGDVRKVASTIESIGARSVSFAGASTNVYGAFTNGRPSSITVSDNIGDTLSTTFAANTGTIEHCRIEGSNAAPIVIGTRTGPKGSIVSACTSCASPDAWCVIGDITDPMVLGPNDNLMSDHTVAVAAAGNSGAGVWDVTSDSFGQGCGEPQRAYGSGSFANVNHLTTALGVDKAAFIWVFKGIAPPPPATVEQQIAEIIRLLLTPEGLRCSGLDTNPGNDTIEDYPVDFPNGKSLDPISPQISSGAKSVQVTGDEAIDDLRSTGWK